MYPHPKGEKYYSVINAGCLDNNGVDQPQSLGLSCSLSLTPLPSTELGVSQTTSQMMTLTDQQ